MSEKYIASIKHIYEIIEPLGKTNNKKDKKKFFNNIKNWKSKPFRELYIKTNRKSPFLSINSVIVDFNGEHNATYESMLETAKFKVTRGFLGPVLYSFDILNLIPEKTKSNSSLVMNEAIVAMKELVAIGFMFSLIKEDIHEFKATEHGEKLFDFLNKLGIVE